MADKTNSLIGQKREYYGIFNPLSTRGCMTIVFKALLTQIRQVTGNFRLIIYLGAGVEYFGI